MAQVQSRAGGYAIEFFGVCFIVAIYLRWFKEEKCLNVRQKLGTRNVIENLKNFFFHVNAQNPELRSCGPLFYIQYFSPV